MAEQTKIKVSHGDQVKDMTIPAAEKLFKIQEKGKVRDKDKWVIADKQPFKYENGVISPTSKGQNPNTGQ
jgi:hypothetical protein